MRRRVPRLQAWRVLSSVATQRSTLAIPVFDSRFCRSCVRVFLVLDIRPCAISLYSKCSAGRRFGTLSKSQTFDVVPSVQPAHAHASHAYIYIYIYIYTYTYIYIHICICVCTDFGSMYMVFVFFQISIRLDVGIHVYTDISLCTLYAFVHIYGNRCKDFDVGTRTWRVALDKGGS
uniref:Putative transmembrane protein n=1 Tax=Toxoplasma gondii TgCATBr9 TaxID=943120 RepID=A0A2T6IVS6_TOXGO|nr:putative transmembrane protein [Toxoplasma gondii TgCATBr9]